MTVRSMLSMPLNLPKPPSEQHQTDVLSSVLDAASLQFAFASVTSLHGAVGVSVPGNLDTALHVVLDGCVFITVKGRRPIRLEAGTLLVLPVDCPHSVADAPGRRLLAVSQLPNLTPDIGASLQIGEGAHRATVLTAAFKMQSPWKNSPLRVLPEAVRLSRTVAARAWELAVCLAQEIRDTQPGRDFLVRRYCEALLMEALRPELEEIPSASLLLGLGDRQLRMALEAIHQNAAREWTVTELARLAGSSRSSLSDRFRKRLGVSPRQYLIHWRMSQASKLLGTTDLSVAEVAAASGYESEPAFARTFKRMMGVSPGRFRRQHR